MLESGLIRRMLPAAKQIINDPYTPIIGSDSYERDQGIPKWLPLAERRRIKAYFVLEDFYNNQDPAIEIQQDMPRVRFGIVAYAVQVLRDLTVGAEQKILVAGAAEEDAQANLVNEQTLLADWAVRNMFFPKLQKAEEHAGLMGDAFFRFRYGKSDGVKDVKVDILRPYFVFPTWDKDQELQTAMVAWEEQIVVNGVKTYALYADYYEVINGVVYETSGWYTYSSAFATLSDLVLIKYDTTVDGQPYDKLNLQMSMIPIIHLPNFWTDFDYGESDLCFNTEQVVEINAAETDMSASARLMGSPSMVVAGLTQRVNINDLTNTEKQTFGPGDIINVDVNGGKAEFMDNSQVFTALMAKSGRDESKFFRNMRLGKLFAGETDNIRDIESQKAFKTLLATLYARITQKRTVRLAVYSKLLTLLRTMLAKISDKSVFSDAKLALELGQILPLDNSDDLSMLATVWQQGKGPMSALTAARLGAKAGTGVVDFKKEADEILQQLSLSSKGQPGGGDTPPADAAPAKKSFSLTKKK